MKPSRSPRTLLALILASLAVVSACGQQAQPKDYGEDYEKNFMLGCTGRDEDGDIPPGGSELASRSYCECVYEGLEEKIPFDEAKEFEDKQSEAESGDEIDVPKNIQSVFDGCES